jgi:hypothetical protein
MSSLDLFLDEVMRLGLDESWRVRTGWDWMSGSYVHDMQSLTL